MILRGSVPVFWIQNGQNPLIYNPAVRMFHKKEKKVLAATKVHLDYVKNLFGSVHVIDLLSRGESYQNEAFLSEAFRSQIEFIEDPCIKYTHFDFHSECQNFSYENLSKLLHSLEEEERAFTFLSAKSSSEGNFSFLSTQVSL